MKGKNFSVNVQRAKCVITDFVMTSLAFFFFNVYRFDIFEHATAGYQNLYDFLTSYKLLWEQMLVPICLMSVYWLSGYYNRPYGRSRVSVLTLTFWSTVVSTMLIYLILLINDTTGERTKDYETILILFAILFSLLYFGRWFLTTITLHHLRSRSWLYSTLIIGNSKRSRNIYKKLVNSGSVWAYDVVGFINIEGEHDVKDGLPSWDWKEVEQVCNEKEIDQIILAPAKLHESQIMNLLAQLFHLNKPVKIAPDTLSFVTANIHLNDILGIPFIDLTSPRISECQKNLKRTIDVIFSTIALILSAPLMLMTALAVKMSSKGPIIYSQERIGKGRKPFKIYKFRSMYVNSEADGPKLSSNNDSRITGVGKFLRKYRLDEIPQFWNVLKGDMSLVGPRPEREYYINQIVKKAPYFGLVFQVKPGITSWGMVKFGYASTVEEMVRRARYDLLYLNNMSISNDFKIMLHTINTVIKGAGK